MDRLADVQRRKAKLDDEIACIQNKLAALEGPIEEIERQIASVSNKIDSLAINDENTRKREKALDEERKLRDKKDELRDKKEELYKEKDKLKDKKDELYKEEQELNKDLSSGKYFAKANDIFPQDNRSLVDKSSFEGKAAELMRDVGTNNFYATEIKELCRQLGKKDDEAASETNMNSLQSTSSSTGQQHTVNSSGEKKQKTRTMDYSNHHRGTNGVREMKKCVIPFYKEKPEKGHLVPDSPSCCSWWPFVCLWIIGHVDGLVSFREENSSEEDDKKRGELKKRLGTALVQLANGINSKAQGIRSNNRNFLYVPARHAEYFDAGYNWIFVPIMTVEEMKNWNGQPYEVAIFTGESDDSMKNVAELKHNFFQDGGLSAINANVAESVLVSTIPPDKINICNTIDMVKVSKILRTLLMAIADLHTRGGPDHNDQSTNTKFCDPDSWKIYDLYEAVLKKPTVGTLQKNFEESANGITDLMRRLTSTTDGSQQPGIYIPGELDTETFNGKHVFKAEIQQSCPPDPILLGTKSAVNLSRQWGMRLLPGCLPESSSSGSSSYGDGFSHSTPQPSRSLIGVEVPIVSPVSPSVDSRIEDDEDTISDVSIIDFDI